MDLGFVSEHWGYARLVIFTASVHYFSFFSHCVGVRWVREVFANEPAYYGFSTLYCIVLALHADDDFGSDGCCERCEV